MGKPSALARFVLLASSILSSCGGSDSGTGTSTVTLGPVVSSWTRVDGGGATGLNRNTAKNGASVNLAYFNSKLYVTWLEANSSSIDQLRVAVNNASDSAPSTTFVDGGGANGLNLNPIYNVGSSKLLAFNGKLYLTWNETNGTVFKIHAAVYNGNDAAAAWTNIDGAAGCLNKSATMTAAFPVLVALGTKLYAVWYESSGLYYQIRAAVYNGNDSAPSWTKVDGNGTNGLNFNAGQSAMYPWPIAYNGKLYLGWMETTSTVSVIHAAVYNGNDSSPAWTFVDGNTVHGLNHDPAQNAALVRFELLNGGLYAAWSEVNSLADQVRVASYNGNDSAPSWKFVDGGTNGINHDPTVNADSVALKTFGNRLYAAWREHDAGNDTIRVGVYGGNDNAPTWTLVDGGASQGLNYGATSTPELPELVASDTRLYCAWDEANATVYQVRLSSGQ